MAVPPTASLHSRRPHWSRARPRRQAPGHRARRALRPSALFTFYRLSSWLAGIAAGDRDYTLGTAWKATRKNRIAYLGFTFWLIFTLAIAGAIGAGAFFAQQMLPQPWVKPTAFAVMGVLAWMAMFLITSVAASHYRAFAKRVENTLVAEP